MNFEKIIFLFVTVLPVDIHPLIDDSRAKNIFMNSTFTLKCFVHIELGVIIVMSWDAPNKKVKLILQIQINLTKTIP